MINADNEACRDPQRGGRRATARSLDEARALAARLPDAASLVGTLVPGMWGVDIDPSDTGAEPILGARVAEQLAAWSEHRDAEWLVRESGRPGGHHVILPVPDESVPELHQFVRQLAAEHGVQIRVARSLRLLTAPHRLGLPAPIVAGTLRPHHVPTGAAGGGRQGPDRRKHRAEQASAAAAAGTATSGGVLASGDQGDTSPSGHAYGCACWMVRIGADRTRAWAATPTCQVVERGEDAWRWFIWLPAVTEVAAEQGLDEGEAWARAQAAHPGRCLRLGRFGWRAQLWEPALVKAATDRPRRFTDPDTPPDLRKNGPRSPEEIAAEQAELEAVRAGLRAAGLRWTGQAGRRPQVRESMDVLLYAMAEVIATGQGKISHRRLAEQAELGDSTVQRRLTDALAGGLLYLVASYRQDGQRCDIYGVGPAAQALVEAARQSEHRSCTPPLAPPTGHADPAKLRARHLAERELFRSGTSKTSADTETIEKDYPDLDPAVPPVVQSRMRQRDWWDNLSPQEQQERRVACRRRLDAMPAEDRGRWVTEWLPRRDLIDDSIDALRAGTAARVDLDRIAAAPMTVHHGRNDPLWREGGTPRPTPPPPAEPVQGTLALDVAPTTARPNATARPTSTASRHRGPGRRPAGRAVP